MAPAEASDLVASGARFQTGSPISVETADAEFSDTVRRGGRDELNVTEGSTPQAEI